MFNIFKFSRVVKETPNLENVTIYPTEITLEAIQKLTSDCHDKVTNVMIYQYYDNCLKNIIDSANDCRYSCRINLHRMKPSAVVIDRVIKMITDKGFTVDRNEHYIHISWKPNDTPVEGMGL
jgi:hypothetical protein